MILSSDGIWDDCSPQVDSYSALVLARLVEFFAADAVPWPRRLWDIGSILALEELWEAGRWEALGVLTPTATDWQRCELRAIIGPDIGLGERELRRELTELLSQRLPDPSAARRRLRQVIDHARIGYLERWAQAVRLPDRPKAERLSRTVAAHLLDLDYSQEYLLRWAGQLRRAGAAATEIVESAAELASGREHEYEVLVGLAKVPQRNQLAEPLENWRSKAQVIDWLRQHGHATASVRTGGGFVYRFVTRDPHGAAAQARQMVDRLVARSAFLRRNRGGVEPLPHVWIADHPEPISLVQAARGADVLSLVHEGHMYRVDGTRSRVDDALELAAPINQGALGPAVAGGWAAVESLLFNPDDPTEEERSGKAVAADRLAAIITCSWPRAELTSLAHHHRPKNPDELTRRLDDCATNHDRARTVAQALTEGITLDFTGSRDRDAERAAAERMTALVGEARRTLCDVRKVIAVAIRRFYRARNIVLHGGSVEGVALEASLRTGAPLIGAGLDRITHAALVERLQPLDLAARAEASCCHRVSAPAAE